MTDRAPPGGTHHVNALGSPHTTNSRRAGPLAPKCFQGEVAK